MEMGNQNKTERRKFTRLGPIYRASKDNPHDNKGMFMKGVVTTTPKDPTTPRNVYATKELFLRRDLQTDVAIHARLKSARGREYTGSCGGCPLVLFKVIWRGGRLLIAIWCL